MTITTGVAPVANVDERMLDRKAEADNVSPTLSIGEEAKSTGPSSEREALRPRGMCKGLKCACLGSRAAFSS